MKNKEIKPNRIATYILRLLLPKDEASFLLGDYLEEFHYIYETQSKLKAHLTYWILVIESIPGFIKNQIIWSLDMFKNYLTVAIRNIKKYKIYSFINISGLAVGIACCMLMISYVLHELSFESMHPLKDQIFRINGKIPFGGQILHNGVVGPTLGPAAKTSIPEVEKSLRIKRESQVPVQIKEKTFIEEMAFIAEQGILEMFSIPLLQGNPQTALKEPFTVIINENLAKKYFGSANPIGQRIRITLGKTFDFSVTGIMKNIPSNTVMSRPIIVSFATINQVRPEAVNEWQSWGWVTTFVLLQEGAHPQTVGEKITSLARSHLPDKEKDASYYLQPLDEIYLNKYKHGMNNDLDNTGSYTRIYVFSLIAILILLVAAINFINLSTAKISGRIKEVGISKTCGAVRSNLVWRFLLESIMLTIIATIIGLFLLIQFKPYMDQYLGKSLNLEVMFNFWFIPIILALILVIGLLAGSYPALFLSRFQAADILKTGVLNRSSRPKLRWILVGIQFFIATSLIFATLIVLKQVKYFEKRDLGFDQKSLLVLKNRGARDLKNGFLLKNQILSQTGVLRAALVDRFPNAQNRSISTYKVSGKRDEKGLLMQSMEIDEDFVNTIGLRLITGQGFQKARVTDKNKVLINQSAARKLGHENQVGKTIFRGEEAFQIIGILDDWNTNSIHSPIYPLVLHRADETASELVVKLPSPNASTVVTQIRDLWTKLLPQQIFESAYVDDYLLRAYYQEQRLADLLISFCQLTVLVACLGIFGLASFSIEQRTKEIGIRKVMGASVGTIVLLLTKKHVYRVLIANVFALPVGYYAVNKWLQTFAYRASINIGHFVLPGIIVLVVTMVSILFQTLKAARANPVDSMRYE
jgi:putative ABC transport system permease protein